MNNDHQYEYIEEQEESIPGIKVWSLLITGTRLFFEHIFEVGLISLSLILFMVLAGAGLYWTPIILDLDSASTFIRVLGYFMIFVIAPIPISLVFLATLLRASYCIIDESPLRMDNIILPSAVYAKVLWEIIRQLFLFILFFLLTSALFPYLVLKLIDTNELTARIMGIILFFVMTCRLLSDRFCALNLIIDRDETCWDAVDIGKELGKEHRKSIMILFFILSIPLFCSFIIPIVVAHILVAFISTTVESLWIHIAGTSFFIFTLTFFYCALVQALLYRILTSDYYEDMTSLNDIEDIHSYKETDYVE